MEGVRSPSLDGINKEIPSYCFKKRSIVMQLAVQVTAGNWVRRARPRVQGRWAKLVSPREGLDSGRSLETGCPFLRGILQHAEDVVDRRAIARILLPTSSCHLPQFLGVAAGRGKDWSRGSQIIKDTKDCHVIVARGKWDTVR